MERAAVYSKDIAIIGYDNSSRILEIAFRSGGVYQYSKVPSNIYQELLAAESHGLYFNEKIKDKYPCIKIN